MFKKMIIIGLIGMLFLGINFTGESFSFSATPQYEGEGDKAPDFDLPAVDGENVKLSYFKGNVVLLNFWTTWCPYCKKEIRTFKDLYKKYKDDGLTVIGIEADEGGSLEKVKKFCEKNDIDYPVVKGNAEVIRAYGGIPGVPTTFVIDKKGNIAKKIYGGSSYRDYESLIKKLLE